MIIDYKTRMSSISALILLLISNRVPVSVISNRVDAVNLLPQAVTVFTFTTQADARVEERNPTLNFGTSNYLQAGATNNQHVESYIRFATSGLSGVVQNAKLRVYSTTNGTNNGPAVYAAGNTWTETGVTWNNRPTRTSGAFDNKGAIARNTWTEYNVTTLVGGNGTYTFVLVGDSTDDVMFSSRESSNPPQLVITVNAITPTATPTTLNTPTRTPTSGPTPTRTPTSVAGSTPTPTNTPSSTDLIFADSFESGSLSTWSASLTDTGDLSVAAAAAMVGSRGMQAVVDDNNILYVGDDRPIAEPRYRARFYFDPNSIAMLSGDSHGILYAYVGTSTAVIRGLFRFYNSAYQVSFGLLNDSGTWQDTTWATLSDGKHSLEIDWKAATSAGANNGSLTMWVDGVQTGSVTAADNDTRRIDLVRIGGVYGIDTGTRGTYYFDDFVSRRQTYIGPASTSSATPTPTSVAGSTSTPTRTSTPTSTSATSGSVVLVGAGDIASCSNNNDEATAKLLDGISGTVFTAGDNAYSTGSTTEYTNCYDPTWGRHKARTKPIPGNHEYGTAGAAGYFQYFNNIPSYYAYNLGAWRIYALNSQIDVSAASAEVAWLQADLAANPSQCVLAYWHEPRWSSGSAHGSNSAMQTLWQILYNAGAELVVNGHEHNYERFAEMNASGAAVTQGLREIVVGTGGASHYAFGTPLSTSQVRNSSTYGVLKLTLRSTGYDWQFVPTAGSTFTENGSSNCH
jgi:acid phosphatase type 7